MTPSINSNRLETYWQRDPFVLHNFLPVSVLRKFTERKFFGWCKPPVQARLFLRTEELGAGSARAFPLESITEGPAIFEHCRKQGDAVTLLLNHAERVDPVLNQIRARFKVPFYWREHDIVATLSLKDAGIGFHAGQEDGFIVQLRGSRCWKVWKPDVLDDRYRRRLLGDVSVEDPHPTRPSERPLLTCILKPGDVLCLPALYAHEGTTLQDSISLSVAWTSLTPYKILCSSDRKLPGLVREHVERHPEALFRLLPRPAGGASRSAEFLFQELKPSLQLLAADAASARACRDYLQGLVRRECRFPVNS